MSEHGDEMKSDEMNLVAVAEKWSENQIQERVQELLQFIHPVLLDENSEHGLRLDCVRFTVEKLARHVPVFEAEDDIFYPLLKGILEFLKQVYERISRTDDADRVITTAIATALVDHAEVLLTHGASYDGLGPGEIPSIPRIIPKILLITFQYCRQEQTTTGSGEVKDSITRLFCQGRKLLENFSSLIGKMKIRTVLEDELEIVLELCSDLLSFHEILFSIDLKSCLFVWKLYGKLVKEHCDRLRLKLNIESALDTLISESVETFRKLESVLQEETENLNKKVNRLIIALTFFVKMIVNLSDEYSNLLKTNLDTFSEFLGFMFLKGDTLFPFMDQLMIDKMQRDIFLLNPEKTFILRVPDMNQFAEFLLIVETNPCSAFTRVQIILSVLDLDVVPDPMKLRLLDVLLETFGYCESENQKPGWLESPEVLGIQVKLFSAYEFVLTRVCGFISSIGPDEFPALEQALFRNLLGDLNLSCQLACDILCYVGRYGSAELCNSHLELISDWYIQLDQGYFSSQHVWLGSLVGRLFNFLGHQEQNKWIERFSPVEPRNLCLWSQVDFQSINQKESLTLIQDITFSRYNLILEESSAEQSLTVLPDILRIFAGLASINLDQNYVSFMLTLWQKLSESGFVPYPKYWLSEFFKALTEFTVSVLPNLTFSELKILISTLRVLSGSARSQGQPLFFVGNLLSILLEESELDWIEDTENMNPSLILDTGNLSSSCLRSGVRNPILKIPGLTFLRNIAERSKNSGFTRLCSDENDVMPHFKLFLKEDHISSVNEKMKFNYSAPKLEYLVNLEDESGLEVKRKVSSASISPRKKRLRTEVEDNDGDVGLILSSIESKLESLTILLRQPGDRTLSKDEKTRLRELSRKALELVS